jgi:hypothetical protein
MCKLIQIGNSTAFICGGEPDHVCNDKLIIYGFSDGFVGTVFDKARIEKLNLQMCDTDKLESLRNHDIHVNSGSVACSICGRAAIDNALHF